MMITMSLGLTLNLSSIQIGQGKRPPHFVESSAPWHLTTLKLMKVSHVGRIMLTIGMKLSNKTHRVVLMIVNSGLSN